MKGERHVNIPFKQGTDLNTMPMQAVWRTRIFAIAVAEAVSVTMALIARVITDRSPRADIGGNVQAISVAQVAVTTVVIGLIAWAVRSGLDRISDHPERAWTILAVVTLAISLLGPLGSGVDGASKAVLAAMHVATAAVFIPLMRPSARR
jgi:hypothetical protein